MPVFKYKARSSRGDSIEGTFEAASTDLVAAHLMEGGLTPVDIKAVVEKAGLGGDLGDLFMPRVETADLIQFSRQMYSMLRASVPIFNTVSGLATTSSNRTLAQTLTQVTRSLESGRPLSDALAQHPQVFSVFYVSLVRVGETSGKLTDIFQQLAYYLDREKTTRDKIKAALRYPMFVLSAILIALLIISVWVIPAFSRLFASFGADLPLATRILMGVSDFILSNWHLLIAATLITVFGVRAYVRTDAGRYRWHKLKLRLPLVGPVMYKAALARFSHLFSLSYKSGVQLISALTVVARALNNSYLEERILGMREGIEHGKSISLTAGGSGIFDPLVLQMLAVGEESGTIGDLLEEVAHYYDREVDYAVDKLSASIEPLLTVVIGGLVLVMAMGVFLPMWDLASVALAK
ncbi:MAG: type II secretion system F family protein [Gammaproteobacteria bacterium]